jgi:hypothetical protein
MRLLGAAGLFLQKALWSGARQQWAGRALVEALGSPDPDLRTLAGMFLVQGGHRAQPLVEEALRERRNLPLVLAIAGDVADRRLEPELVRFSEDRDPNVAKAAKDALRVLHARHQAGPHSPRP